MEGKTNPIEDVGIRLAHGLHDLHLEENLAPTREAISRGLTSGSDSLWKTYSFLRTDLGKRQAEYRERHPDLAPPVLATTVLAGADFAKTGAATLATGIGSFLSSSRRSLFMRAPTPEPDVVPPPREAPPASEGRYPPPRANSTPPTDPSFPAFFRPLSTSSLATSPSVLNTPAPATPASWFRRSFIEPSPAASPAASIAPSSAPPSAPPTPPARASEDEVQVRDLDAEYAAKGKRASAESTAVSDEGFEVVPNPMRRSSSAGASAATDEDEGDTLLAGV